MTTPRAFILHCPALGRDLSHIQAHVPQVEVMQTAVTPGRHDGAIGGHRAIIDLAKKHGWSEVMILEDDCQFTEAFSMETWLSDLHWARMHGYTMLNGGCYASRHPRVVRDGLFAVDHCKSAHCLVYLPGAYGIAARLTFPFDVMLGRLGAKIVVTYPFVAVQGPGYSGIQCKSVDYEPGYARHQAYLGTLLPQAVPA